MLHGQRIRRIAALAFGPDRRPAVWASSAPLLRVASLTALSWGLLTLIDIDPKVHKGEVLADGDYKHVMMVLDVSPSMRLEDAGPEHDLSRMKRARVVMESFFKRVPMEQYRVSVVAVYNEAKPVVLDTKDIDVVRNILGDLPMHYAFVPGETDLFTGLKEAIKLAKPWQPDSTTLILISDGDTVPATGMPKMPASGFTLRMLPSSPIHIWARSSPTNRFPAMAVVVLPHPDGAAPANQVTRLPGPRIPVMNMCSDSSSPGFLYTALSTANR